MNNELTEALSYAIAIGCLKSVADVCDGRQAGRCASLADSLGRIGYKMPRISSSNVELLKKCIHESSIHINKIGDEGNMVNTLLNLSSFCLEEVSITTRHHGHKMRHCFEAFDSSTEYLDIRLGERAFTRLMSELNFMKLEEVQ